MSYNSGEVNQADVRRFKKVLDNFNLSILTPTEQLAFAQALEIKATEVRQHAVSLSED